MNPRKFPLLQRLTRFGLLLGLLAAEVQAADLFSKTSIPGWTNLPPHPVFSAWGDYDGDGLLDIFVGLVKNNTAWTGATTNLLYHHNADHSFTQKSATDVGALVSDLVFGEAHWIDVNGDGHLDLWNMAFGDWGANSSPVVGPLYLNRGDATFAAVAAGALTTPRLPWGFAGWADYDNDGLLDVYIPTSWDAWSTRTNALLHGRADGTFELVTSGRIVTDVSVGSNNSIWGDLDGDGDADLLVANNFSRGFYYRNDGGGSFTRMTNSPLDNAAYPCSHHALGDFDRDGDLDVIAYGQGAAYIFFNNGAGVFTLSQTFTRGGAETPYPGDYDNDGDLDFVLSEVSLESKPLTLFRNDGTGKFAIVTEAFTGVVSRWTLGPWTDYDNDGFLDLCVGEGTSGMRPIWLYRNQGNGNHWLKLNLVGTHSHRSAIGAKIRVRANLGGQTVWQLREIVGNRTAEDGRRAHFGLGDAMVAEEVRIEWPSGNVQTLTHLAADQILTVTEPVVVRPEHPVVTIGGRLNLTNLAADTARQWYFEGAPLENQVNRVLTLANTQPAQAGRYTVVAQTDAGPLTNHVYVRVETQFTKILEGPVVTESRECSYASWFDFDNDGYVDLYVPNGAPPNSLFHNLRDGTFQRAPNTTLLALQRLALFVAPGDFNRDGNLDLFVGSLGTNEELFLGDGAGVFAPLQGQPFQLKHQPGNMGLADIDGDGDLDVMTVGNQGNTLYRNEGGTRFVSAAPAEVGSLLDPPAPNRQPWGCAWSDYDADGNPDVVIMYDGGVPTLHRGLGGGRFVQAQAGSLTTLQTHGACAFGDYDNDGDLDAFTGRWQVQHARLHRNGGDGTFTEIGQAGDLGAIALSGYGSWVDYDNDGFLDLFFLAYDQVGSMYRNRGDGTFQAVNLGNLASDGTRRGMAAWADYDNNGFLDLLVVCGDGLVARNQLYRNNGNGNHWLRFRLAGTTSNRDGIGARVRVKATIQGRSLWQLREIQSAGGDASSTPLLAHFGLGDATQAEEIRIEWPSGNVQTLTHLAADQILTVTEPVVVRPEHPVVTINGRLNLTNLVAATARQWYFEGALLEGQTNRVLTLTNAQPAQAGRYSVVAQTDAATVTNHVYVRVETQFTKIVEGDIVTESAASVAGLWFDWDNDGLLDLHVANNVQTPKDSLFHNEGGGKFSTILDSPIVKRPGLFSGPGTAVDIDQDGDPDLFVVRGGLRIDTLFRNEGLGVFQPVTNMAINGSPGESLDSAWADYDRDGDLDLFLAEGFGNAASETLLRNNGDGTFSRVTASEAGSLLLDGLRTWSCSWADYDADGWPDALVQHANGQVRLYHNDGNGRLSRVLGTSLDLTGDFGCPWGDYDNDGYLDVLVGAFQVQRSSLHHNLAGTSFANVTRAAGLTFPSQGHPAWGDYDNDGFLDFFFAGYKEPSVLYRNRGDGTFQRIDAGNLLTDGVLRNAAVWADYDNNGFLDLFIACGDYEAHPNQLFLNNGNGNHWLKVRLAGAVPNRDGIGAKVRVQATINGRTFWQLREISGNSAGHGVPLLAHFGLGNATNATNVRIEWPSGTVQELTKVATNQALTVTEPAPIRLSWVLVPEGIRLECRGAANATYEIQASTDLKRWSVFTTTTTDATGLAVSSASTEEGVRFYRAVRP